MFLLPLQRFESFCRLVLSSMEPTQTDLKVSVPITLTIHQQICLLVYLYAMLDCVLLGSNRLDWLIYLCFIKIENFFFVDLVDELFHVESEDQFEMVKCQ